MRSIRIRRTILSVVLLLPALFVSFADAQTTTRKKKPRTTAVSIPPVSQPATDPIIVSRASDYQNADNGAVVSTDNTNTAAVETKRDRQLADLSARIKQLESELKNGYDEKQKRLLLNLDILTKAEQRSESLRKQRFDLIDKENQIQSRLDQIEIDRVPLVITKRGRAIARVVPMEDVSTGRSTMRSIHLVAEADDAYYGTGETWEAEVRS